MSTNEIIKRGKNIIRNRLGNNVKIFLFGSHAKGNYLRTSDIDIAVEQSYPIDYKVYYAIIEEIQQIPTLKKIDIVDLKLVSRKFRKNVLSYAIPL